MTADWTGRRAGILLNQPEPLPYTGSELSFQVSFFCFQMHHPILELGDIWKAVELCMYVSVKTLFNSDLDVVLHKRFVGFGLTQCGKEFLALNKHVSEL